MKVTIRQMARLINIDLHASRDKLFDDDFSFSLTDEIQDTIAKQLGVEHSPTGVYIDIVDVEETEPSIRKDISPFMEPGSVEHLSPDTMSKGNEKVIEKKIQALLDKYKATD